MAFEIYRVVKEEKIAEVAAKFKITVAELKRLNPNIRYFTAIFGPEYIGALQDVKVPYIANTIKKEKNIIIENESLKNIEFDQNERYRCEQINVSKVDGNTVHFVEQKFQYLLQRSTNQNIGKVKLEEHLYNFSPPVLNLSFEFISKTEFIKNNVTFDISKDNGRVEKVLNKAQINSNWVNFRKTEFEESEFIKRLKQTNPNAVEELKGLGNKQFSPNYDLAEEEYRRNLFYFCCFDEFIVKSFEEIKPENFLFMSTIVPPVIVPIEFRYDKISEKDGILKLRKVGTLKLNPQLVEEVEKKYNEMHKPNIKYGFTEYKLEFRTRIEYNLEEKIVETADVFIMEQIADNVANTCEFHLKRLQNFKP